MPEKKKESKLPTDPRLWDAKVRLRFLSRFENLIRKVPMSCRAVVYCEAAESLRNEGYISAEKEAAAATVMQQLRAAAE